MKITRNDIKDFVADAPNRCFDAHLILTPLAVAAIALSYRSPAALAQVVSPQRWAQVAKWASAAGLASFVAGGALNALGWEASTKAVYEFVDISKHVPEPMQEAFRWVLLVGLACQVTAIGFFAASFAPHIKNKSMCRFAAAVLTTCFNTSFAVSMITVKG